MMDAQETHLCADCGQDSMDYYYGVDPYKEEIHPEKVKPGDEQWMCRGCYRSSCEDI